MSTHHIRYDLLTQDALRGMVRRVLADTARMGLPGEHHFFISFKTQYPGVSIPVRLAEKFPEEITIVLQHQFWDLTVSDQGFEVGLSFGNAPERLIVPLAAVTAFFDPSVDFGVKFEVDEPEGAAVASEIKPIPVVHAVPAAEEPEPKKAPVKSARAKKAERPVEEVVQESPAGTSEPDKPAESEKIVSLDHFRKKK